MADEITLDAPETRIERFLAAAAGVDGITLDEPVTRIEKYLYKIAQGGGVPAVEDADKGKYLHANESTGDLEWATAGGSGGGVLVVGCTASGELGNVYTLDKTWQEIQDADYPVAVMRNEYGNTYGIILYAQFSVPLNTYSVGVEGLFMDAVEFATNSASGYPTYTNE